jgi:hypothetical protein
MPNIMIRCPVFNTAVPTGLTTDMIKLDNLDITLSMRCPACRNIHQWKQKDAWVEGENGKPGRKKP